MTIDIRATVSCDIGGSTVTLINGSISDDYIQGSGLVKTKGSMEVSGIITPAQGSAVTFSYTKGGITRSIPRKLRVMSSFADPFRNTTKVELGCKLTYLSDLQEPLKWGAFNDPENRDVPAAEREIVTHAIFASSIGSRCLVRLGLARSGPWLTNAFSIEEFDFSAGYVSILSDLLASESLCGYLDQNEVLQTFSLEQRGGTGPVIDSGKIIDVSPIGLGQIPAEAVSVSYSTLKLKEPEKAEGSTETDEPVSGGVNVTPGGGGGGGGTTGGGEVGPEEAIQMQEELNWELIRTSGTTQTFYISYTPNGATESQVAEYKGAFSTVTRVKYTSIAIKPEAITPPEGESFVLIGNINTLPVFYIIGTTASLTPEQQTTFETDPVSVLEAVWPDAAQYGYVASAGDKWVYLNGDWTFNPPTFQQLYEQDPQSILNQFWPSPNVYDYVADTPDKWIHVGGGSWTLQKAATDDEQQYEKKDVPKTRTTYEYGPSISFAASAATDFLTYGYGFGSQQVLISKTVEVFKYDKAGNQIGSTRTVSELGLKIAGSSSLRWADASYQVPLDSANLNSLRETERTVTTNSIKGDYEKVVTTTYKKYMFTQVGQNEIAKAAEEITTAAQTTELIDLILGAGLVHFDTTTQTSRRGVNSTQERPPVADRINAEYAAGQTSTTEKDAAIAKPEDSSSSEDQAVADEQADPNNGYRVESTSETVLAVGSPLALRRIELSMPYAPDDRFTKSGTGDSAKYYSTRSDAKQKAAKYGRCQNRLLFGNRYGMNLQVAPETLPAAPFSPIIVQASSLSAMYRVNATSWQMSSDGVLASTDALFWGGVGGSGTSVWFPVAPGVTTLPATPPISGGSMTVTNVVPVWNETVLLTGTLRVGVRVQRVPYSLTQLTPVTIAVRFNVTNLRISSFTVSGAADSVIAALVPRFETSVDVRPPVADSTIDAPVPVAGREVGIYVGATAIDIVIAAYAPVVPGSLQIRPPADDVAVAAPVPTVGRYVGVYADPPAANIAVAALAPTGP